MEQEYFAIRNATTLYDLTPMVKYRIAGPDALRYLIVWSRAISASSKPTGSPTACGATMPAMSSTTARCSVSARASIGCARRNARSNGCSIPRIGFDVEISEVTEQIAALAVQGPTSCAVLKACGPAGRRGIKPFEIGVLHSRAAID